MRTLTFHRVLGRGAMGTVYQAELKAPGGFVRGCAAKVIRATGPDRDQVITRMRDEARLLGLLQDEQVLGVSELVRVGEHDAVVMDYVEGVDLAELLSQRVPPKALCELGGEVAGVLFRAHQARHPTTGEHLGVVHRDVKPPNIMVTARGGVKLLDFGVASARFSDRESVTQGLVLGTLFYLAPEVLTDVHVDTKEFGVRFGPEVDIYGLGITLWECAAGRSWGKPMIDQRRFETRVNQRLSELDAGYAPILPLLKSMLSWEPFERPSGAEVERELLKLSTSLSGEGLRTWARLVVPSAIDARSQSNRTDEWVGKTFEVRPIGEGTQNGDTESYFQSKPQERTPPPSMSRQTPPPLAARAAPNAGPPPAPTPLHPQRGFDSPDNTAKTANPLKSAGRKTPVAAPARGMPNRTPSPPPARTNSGSIPRTQGPLPPPEPLRISSNLYTSNDPVTHTLQKRVMPASGPQRPSILMVLVAGFGLGSLLGLAFMCFFLLIALVLK